MWSQLDLHGGGVHILFFKKFLWTVLKINKCQTMLEERH